MEHLKCSEECRSNSSKEWDSAFPFGAISMKVSALVVFITGTVTFLNSVNGQFVFDDSEAVLNNQDVLTESPLSNIFINDFWGTRLTLNKSHKSYRPIAVLTFRWNYWMAGGMHPFGFHATNIFLHGVVSALVVPVSNYLFGGNSPRMAFITSLLFAVHPIHTEAVAAIVGRADLLCALFSFLSFLFYAKASKLAVMSTTVKSAIYLIFSLFLCTLALFSKEQGITILGICIAYDVLILHRINIFFLPVFALSTLFSWCYGNFGADSSSRVSKILQVSCKRKEDFQHLFKKPFLMRLSALSVVGVLLMLVRWQAMGSKPPIFQKVDNPASFAENFWTRAWTYNYLYSLNAWLLVCPEWLSFDWAMGCVPLLSHVNDIRLLAIAAFWGSLLALLWRSITSANQRSGRTVTMALAVAIISFLPASNLFFRVGFVLAERVLYLPSLGFCMLIALGLRSIFLTKPQCRQGIMAAFSCILLLFCIRSVQRSSEWLEEYTLFHSALSVCPLNAKVHYNVAKNAGDRGETALAVKEYRTALKLHPDYDQAMNNLANILRDQGNLVEAESLLRQALKIRPDFAAAWMNLGIVLASMKIHKEAEFCYSQALYFRSHYPESFYNLGNLYLDLKMHEKALKAFQNAVKQKPTFSIAWNNMVIMLENLGNLMDAKSVAHEALSVLPDDPGLHFNLANTLGKMSLFPSAEEHFKKALKLAPNNAIYHSNLGVLYHRWKKYDLAEEKYKDSLKLDPLLKSAVNNLAMLRKSRKQ